MCKRLLTKIILLLVVLITAATPLAAQSEAESLRIVAVDTSNFPKISVTLVATDADNNVIDDLSGLTLREDDKLVVDFEPEQFDAGTEIIFVIDADTSIERRDDNSGLSRREKVRDSIVRFANLYMDPTQADRVSIIVPEGDGGLFLEEAGMTFPTQVINTINFYETGDLGDTGLNRMLHLALNQAESNKEDGRYQAIVLFSEASNLDDQLDYETLVENAQEGGIAFYTAILGATASDAEKESVSRLTDPTAGLQIHMPAVEDADPLYDAIQQRSNQHKLD